MLTDPTIEALAARLEATGDYRVLRRLQVPGGNFIPMPHMKRAVFLDVETTGLDPNVDEIIELAMVPFWYEDSGRIAGMGIGRSELRQPQKPIPAEVTQLTGITPDMVAGKTIDFAAAAQFAGDGLIVAHNAAFDRRFVERFCPQLANNRWACSLSEIPWAAHGFESAKLSLIGQTHGFFYDGHRAVNDCYAGIEVLSRSVPVGGTESAMKILLSSSNSRSWRCWAEGAPFEKKDLLKSRGYRWADGSDGRPRAWWIDLDEAGFHGEMAYLRSNIYGWSAQIHICELNALNRYSDRLNLMPYALPAN